MSRFSIHAASHPMKTFAPLTVSVALAILVAGGCGGNGVDDPADGRVILFQDGFESYQANTSLPGNKGEWFHLGQEGAFPILDSQSGIVAFAGTKALSLYSPGVDELSSFAGTQEIPRGARELGAQAELFCPKSIPAGTFGLRLRSGGVTVHLDFANKQIGTALGFDNPFFRPWKAPIGRWFLFQVKFIRPISSDGLAAREYYVDGVLIRRDEIVPSALPLLPGFGTAKVWVDTDVTAGQAILMDNFEAWYRP